MGTYVYILNLLTYTSHTSGVHTHPHSRTHAHTAHTTRFPLSHALSHTYAPIAAGKGGGGGGGPHEWGGGRRQTTLRR